MVSNGNIYTRVDHPMEIDRLLDMFYRPGGASIVAEGHPVDLPVVVEPDQAGDSLQLDMTAIDKHIGGLLEGRGFRLVGDSGQGMVRTPVLTLKRTWQARERLFGACDFPDHLEKMQRRDSFRARLRRGMIVRVDLHDDTHASTGTLRDLSLRGCLAMLAPSAVVLLDDRDQALDLDLAFPDGTTFHTRAWPRHQSVDNDCIACGFLFDVDVRQQQQLWHLVRETEREAARGARSDNAHLRPSSLFTGDALARMRDSSAQRYQTPAARHLARQADFLSLQILQLRRGEPIDSAGLSRHAEDLLATHESGREEVLFALACLDQELPLVHHCLAVAVRMVDISESVQLPRESRKALAAAAMVHDLGKALLPARLTAAARLDREQYRALQQHVALIMERLHTCKWLAQAALEPMVECINERLDGSGYPARRGDVDLHQLARLAAVIDVADAMGRDRPDRAGMPIHRIYAHLAQSAEKYDARWVQRYMMHFGRWPIGTLVRFRGGELAWVRSLDAAGRLQEVKQVADAGRPDSASGTTLRGGQLRKLGEPVEAVRANS